MKRLLATLKTVLCVLALTGAAPAVAANRPMPTQGGTSQPIGHYEFCRTQPRDCGRNAEIGYVRLSTATWTKLAEINEAVNVSVFPRTDMEMHGVPELWSYPNAEGDCEDYVLLKQYMLERAGMPRSALLITVVRQPNGDGHAVLTVRTDRGDFILDNLQDKVLDWKETDYRFLKRQSEANSAKWVAIVDDRDVLVGSVR